MVDALPRELDGALGDVAALGAQQARDGLERGRLPGAVGAEQRRDLALAAADGHALEHEDDAVVDDFDVVERQHDVGGRRVGDEGPSHVAARRGVARNPRIAGDAGSVRRAWPARAGDQRHPHASGYFFAPASLMCLATTS